MSARFRDIYKIACGEVAEWFKAHAWKACWGASPSGVRIPSSLPLTKFPKNDRSDATQFPLCDETRLPIYLIRFGRKRPQAICAAIRQADPAHRHSGRQATGADWRRGR